MGRTNTCVREIDMSKSTCLEPFVLSIHPTQLLRAAIRDLLDSVEFRQKKYNGSDIRGKVFRRLVEAKFSLILPSKPRYMVNMYPDSFSCSDCEFFIGDVVVHVPSFPGEVVISKCQHNIDDGFHPIIITTCQRVPVAEGLAESAGIANRLEVWDIEQFLSMNLNERGLFCQAGRKDMASRLVDAYNKIIDACETDPSLKIEIGAR